MTVTHKRILIARITAVVADALQIGILPIFAGGGLSVINDALDVVVAVAMVTLVGWHWAFVPAFRSELVPVLDLVPTWTAAVLLATRQGAATPPPGDAAGPPLAEPRRPALPPKGE